MAPMFRPRRLREKGLFRALVRETTLAIDDLIYPLFVVHGRGVREPLDSMPGQARVSVDELVKEAKDAAGMGIPGVLLFGLPTAKDPRGSEAYAEDGIVQQAVRAVKDTVPDLLVMTDVCLCQYTSHGHCGVVEDGSVRNDPTLELLARTSGTPPTRRRSSATGARTRWTRPTRRRRCARSPSISTRGRTSSW